MVVFIYLCLDVNELYSNIHSDFHEIEAPNSFCNGTGVITFCIHFSSSWLGLKLCGRIWLEGSKENSYTINQYLLLTAAAVRRVQQKLCSELTSVYHNVCANLSKKPKKRKN